MTQVSYPGQPGHKKGGKRSFNFIGMGEKSPNIPKIHLWKSSSMFAFICDIQQTDGFWTQLFGLMFLGSWSQLQSAVCTLYWGFIGVFISWLWANSKLWCEITEPVWIQRSSCEFEWCFKSPQSDGLCWKPKLDPGGLPKPVDLCVLSKWRVVACGEFTLESSGLSLSFFSYFKSMWTEDKLTEVSWAILPVSSVGLIYL